MSSYYARITQGMGAERLVAITGRTGVALRVIDVDISGNPVGSASYVPANVGQVELTRNSQGFLVESEENGNEEEIDWEAHESDIGKSIGDEEGDGNDWHDKYESDMSSLSPTNPFLAGFPDLQ